MPGGQACSGEPLRACRVLAPERSEPSAQPPGRIASTMRDREERARIAAGSKLTEDAACDPEMPLDDEVHEVMRQPRVIARTARHVQDVAAGPTSRNRVGPLPGLGEGDLHATNYATVALPTSARVPVACSTLMVASVERVREVRAGLLAAGSVVDRVAGRSHALFPVAIGGEEGSALCDWVRREGAVATLEIGLGYGIATLFICEALLRNGAGARHVAIDPYQFAAGPEHRPRFAGTGLQVLEEAGIRPLVEFYEEESQVVLPRLLSDRR